MKHRGSLKITNELLRAVLSLPEGVKIISATYDPHREITNFFFESDEKIEGFTYDICEGQEIPNIDGEVWNHARVEQAYQVVENTIRKVVH